MQSLCGEKAAAAVSSTISIFLFVYLLVSGIYGAYWRGESVGMYCKVLCWWAILQMVVFSCFLGLLCCGAAGHLIIKNAIIANMRGEYEEKIKGISGPRKDYYESQLFKDKCDRLFEKADADGSGTLDMHELEAILVEVTGEENIRGIVPLLQQAFEEHGDSVVEKHEFVEMMKFVSVNHLQEGKFTLEQAYEILQVEQGAPKSEVTKSYRKMAIKYHPDKRTDVDAEVAKRDMAQINDAKAKVDEYLKLQEKTQD